MEHLVKTLEHTVFELVDSFSDLDRDRFVQAARDEKLGILSELLDMSETDVLQSLAESMQIPYLSQVTPAKNGMEKLPLRLIQDYQCIPIDYPDFNESSEDVAEDETEDDTLYLAIGSVPDQDMESWIYTATGKQPTWVFSNPEKIDDLITQAYGVGASSLQDSDISDLVDEEDDNNEDENAAIIRFINEIIERAIEERATDIHFEPQKETLQIRYRIDGQLDPIRLPDNLQQFQRAIISRLKIMARLNIAELRRPQDGRIEFNSAKSPIDIRISTLPTMYGESLSLRLLNQKNQPLSVKELGLLDDDETILLKSAARPHGIILVTGPTGSGKSTTLTAIIRRIQSPERRIMTVEDPVEYEVPGVNQTQVHSDIGLDFAAALRTVLRQDPDVIMVGEIRDRETADIAIRASLTGHLVLSTLHTNDSAGALTRLADMGIETFLIASSVELIVAQRLVRRLNAAYITEANIEETYLRRCLATLHVPVDESEFVNLLKEPNPPADHPTAGFRGRLGIFEMLDVSERIHEMIVRKESSRVIRRQAIAEGMRTLQQCGWLQCKNGLTTLSEIMRLADAVDS